MPADLKNAFNSIIRPRVLKLSKEMDSDEARKEIRTWVQEQGIAGVQQQDINAKTEELHKKWEEADGPSITFKKTKNDVEIEVEQKKQYSETSDKDAKKCSLI